MKKIFSMVGLFLLIGMSIAYADELEIKDKDIVPPTPTPIPIEIQPQLRMLSDSMAEVRGTSTQRQIRNYRMEIKTFDNYITVKNVGLQESYEAILWQSRQYEQSKKYSIPSLKPGKDVRIFTDTQNWRFNIDYWA